MNKCYSQLAYDKYIEDGIATTLRASGGCYGGGSEVLVIDYQKVIGSLCARDTKGVGNQYAMEGKVIVETKEIKEPSGLDGYNATLTGDKSATLGVNCGMSTGRNGVVMATQQGGAEIRTDGKAPTLTAAAGMSGNNQPVYCAFQGQAAVSAGITASDRVSPTIQANKQADVTDGFIVRRLTPLECERLQGYPDGWTQIGEIAGFTQYELNKKKYVDTVYKYKDSTGKERKTSDSARYKALGNSIALPPWFYVLTKLSLSRAVQTPLWQACLTVSAVFRSYGNILTAKVNASGQAK